MVRGAGRASVGRVHAGVLIQVQRDDLAVVLLEHQAVELQPVVFGVRVPRAGLGLLVAHHFAAHRGRQSVALAGHLLNDLDALAGLESEGLERHGAEYRRGEARPAAKRNGPRRSGGRWNTLRTSPAFTARGTARC